MTRLVQWCSAALLGSVLLCGCSSGLYGVSRGGREMLLKIRWQRLVDDRGATCERCGGTQGELARAVTMLKRALRPLGMQIALEQAELGPAECARDIMASNRIWIAERPLEDWLDAEVGASVCGSCCATLGATVDCRTMSLGAETYEVIPAELIVKAGLIAAAGMLGRPSSGACCPAADGPAGHDGKCCP